MSPTVDVLYRIKRGLAGYVSYLAACEMNKAFSEYVLYEPILRILTARGWKVRCECVCPGIKQPDRGDKKKIDFVATQNKTRFALEVKWAKSASIKVENDVQKLIAFENYYPDSNSFLCVFGRQTHIKDISLKGFPKGIRHWERGTMTIADLRRTRYSCRVFELTAT